MMSKLNQTIGKVRRRRALSDGLSGGGRGFATGAVLALGILISSRLLGYELPVAAYPALILAGLVIGAARAVIRIPPAFAIALHLDRVMGLRDRLATAYALSAFRPPLSAAESPMPASSAPRRANHDPEFASIVQQEGEHLADRIDVRSLTPVHISATWWGGLALIVVGALAYLYMPTIAWGEQRHDPTVAAVDEETEAEQQRLRASIDQIMEEMREDEDDPDVQEELDALQRLADQLAVGTGDPADVRRARDESAARLNELADRLAEQARRDREAADRLAERFAGLESPERPMSAQEFDEALKRGDFGEAARAMEEQLGLRDAMTAEERRELAEHLRNTADQVDQITADGDPELDEREAQLEQLLRDHGFDDDWMRDLMHGDEQSQREAIQRLEEFLGDEEHAQRMQREIDRLREDRELVEQLQRDLEAVNEAMREAADELDPPTPDPPTPRDSEVPDAADDPTQPPHDDPHEPEEPRGEDPVADEPERDREQQPETEVEREQQQQEAESEQQREETREEQVAEDQRVEEPSGVEETVQEREAVEEAAHDPDAEQVGDVPSPDETAEQEHEVPGEAVGEDQQDMQEQRRSPSDVMREIEERRRAAERRQQASERARQRARELADAPERDIPRELERQLRRDPAADRTAGLDGEPRPDAPPSDPRDAETDDIDARLHDDDPGEVIAEWFSDEEIDADPEVRRAQIAQRVREAQRIAERAVEEAAVPTRYHEIVRRYFGRLDENESR